MNKIKVPNSDKKRKDIFSKKKRSEIMAAIKSKNTNLERGVFSFLRKNGCRFCTHRKNVFGKPDIAIISEKKAVFIDSDFWHGWQYPKWKNNLNGDFWVKKIEANRNRDKKVNRLLKKEGWRVLRIWEHELEVKRDESLNKIVDFLKK